jgi:hypothetical protein
VSGVVCLGLWACADRRSFTNATDTAMLRVVMAAVQGESEHGLYLTCTDDPTMLFLDRVSFSTPRCQIAPRNVLLTPLPQHHLANAAPGSGDDLATYGRHVEHVRTDSLYIQLIGTGYVIIQEQSP